MGDQSNLTDLPPEIIISILSRLPIKSVISCKCVNKPWLQLLQTPEFVNSHLSKSHPGIITQQTYRPPPHSESIKICELVDELELDSHELHYSLIAEFDIQEFISPTRTTISVDGSTDGLIFVRGIPRPQVYYVCNPITREYIVLPENGGVFQYPSIATFGFGKSKASGLYKVVRIFHERVLHPDTHKLLCIPRSECQVYTLGTGTWRSVAPDSSHGYNCRSAGAFIDGNLHWLVPDLRGKLFISCLDLESEQFSRFSPPVALTIRTLSSLTALDNRLCVCDNTSETEIVIWIMKEYGVEKSWTKEFVISKGPDFAGECYEVVYPLKVFKDGDILMLWDEFYLFYYSSQTKSTAMVDSFGGERFCYLRARLHVPSFVSLRSFMSENDKFGTVKNQSWKNSFTDFSGQYIHHFSLLYY